MPAVHRWVDAGVHRVPAPFRSFAVRCDELEHAFDARSPYGRVHVVTSVDDDETTLAELAANGRSLTRLDAVGDVVHALTNFDALVAAAPGAADLADRLVAALQQAQLPGLDHDTCHGHLARRIDHLATWGAGFHNDVDRHFPRCLFWLLALDVADAEFVMPHAGVRIALAPGDLLVFDPTMAHGLCRPRDEGQSVPDSFESGTNDRQYFLTGELPLSDAQWAALGVPWRPVEWHDERGALDLRVAEFDERSGAIKGLRAMRDGMKRSTCHADGSPG